MAPRRLIRSMSVILTAFAERTRNITEILKLDKLSKVILNLQGMMLRDRRYASEYYISFTIPMLCHYFTQSNFITDFCT